MGKSALTFVDSGGGEETYCGSPDDDSGGIRHPTTEKGVFAPKALFDQQQIAYSVSKKVCPTGYIDIYIYNATGELESKAPPRNKHGRNFWELLRTFSKKINMGPNFWREFQKNKHASNI